MPISIGGDSIYAMTTENAKNNAKAAAIDQKLSSLQSGTSDEELLEACKSFESYLLEKMIGAMEATVPKEEEESEYEAYFKDMLFQEYAQQMTENNEIGIAKQLYEAMKRNGEVPKADI